MGIRVVNQMAEEGMKLFCREPHWSTPSRRARKCGSLHLPGFEKDAVVYAFISAACLFLFLSYS